MSSLLHVRRPMLGGQFWRQWGSRLKQWDNHFVQWDSHLAQWDSHFRQSVKLSTSALSSHPFSSSMPHDSSRCDNDGVTWLHPGNFRVDMMIAKNKNKHFQSGSQVTINTDTLLTAEDFSHVLVHLYNKVEVLRTCFRQRDDQWWYCSMPKPALDFKVVEGPDSLKESQAMINTNFNLTDGPLWKVRLLQSPTDTPCIWPELNEKFPYRNKLLFSFHHGVIDGNDSLSITAWFVKLLDDYISKKPIGNQQLGQLIDHSQTTEIERQVKVDLEKDPEKLKLFLNELKNNEHTPLLIEAFGTPEATNVTTEYLECGILDTSEVKKFHNMCISQGISFNSGFIGIVNTALVELVREAGVLRDVYNINSLHSIDLRRYITCYSKVLPMGYHASPLSHTMSTPYNVKDHFWKYAKQFDTEFREKLENKQVFKDLAMRRMILPENVSLDELSAAPPTPRHDYSFSNMYLPKFVNFGVGRHVQITGLKILLSLVASDFPFFSGIRNLRDKVQFDVWHSTHCMTSDTAQKCFDKVLSVFREKIK
ncbi:uncharacterized protein [Cherax quadricarinatus]